MERELIGNRRNALKFLTASVASTALMSCSHRGANSGGSTGLSPGISTYTVRSLLEERPLQTAEWLCRLGFREFEFYAAGYFGHEPSEWRSVLADLGASAPSRMVRIDELRSDPSRIVEDCQSAGHSYLALGYLHERERRSLDDYRKLADFFQGVGETLSSARIQFGYHHHAFELQEMEGKLPLDLLIERTNANAMRLTIDTYHVRRAGLDPIAVLNRYAGRTHALHIKDMADDGTTMVPAGEGVIDFESILSHPGTRMLQHAFIEHGPQDSPRRAATTGLTNLTRWLGYRSGA